MSVHNRVGELEKSYWGQTVKGVGGILGSLLWAQEEGRLEGGARKRLGPRAWQGQMPAWTEGPANTFLQAQHPRTAEDPEFGEIGLDLQIFSPETFLWHSLNQEGTSEGQMLSREMEPGLGERGVLLLLLGAQINEDVGLG